MSKAKSKRNRRAGTTRKRSSAFSQVMGIRRGLERQLSFEPLESRQLMTITPSFLGAASVLAGTDVNVSKTPFNQTEVHIAANPTDPGNVVVMSNGGFGAAGTALRSSEFTAFSQDAGANWTVVPITMTQDGRNSTDRFDGATAVDDFGNTHIVYMRRPPGGANNDIMYARSADGGASYTDFRQIARGADVDKPWVAVGPDAANPANQAVWVTYTNSTGGNQRIFATGASVSSLGTVAAFAPVVQVNDGGTQNNYSVPAVGPNGELVVTWMSPSSGQGPANIQFDRDLNGLTGGIAFGADATVTPTNAGGFDFIPATPERSTFASPYVAYDRSGGAHHGRLYLVYADENPAESNDFDIFLRRSDSNGNAGTWSAPVQVNDDAGTNSQFFQNISVDQTNGAVWISWYDARNDFGAGPGVGNIDDGAGLVNTEVQYFASVSVDGGVTFLPNIQVSDGASDEQRGNPSTNDFGDYTGIAAFGGTAYATWADNSNSTGDLAGSNPGANSFPFEVYADRLTLDWAGGQTVTLSGGGGTDVWLIRPDESGRFLQFFESDSATGKPKYTATLSTVDSIVIDGAGGNDQILIESLGPGFSGTITVNGGDGADLLFDLQGIAPGSISNVEAISHTTVTVTGQPRWQAQGPGPIQGGLVAGIEHKPVAGAIQAVLIDPNRPGVMYVGSVNGGVWRTRTGGTDWDPLTDEFPSLSITTLAFDHADATKKTVYAGTGKASSYYNYGKAIGLMKGVEADDGSMSWTLIRKPEFEDNPIHALFINGATWLVATRNGLYRSTDTGATFEHVSGHKVTAAAISAAGAGYQIGDIVSAGAISEPAQVRIDAIGPGGAVTTVSVVNQGSYVSQLANPVDAGGGAGTGLKLNLTYLADTSTLPIASGTHAMAVDPADPSRVFVGVPGDSMGVYFSSNGGATFTAVNTGLDLTDALAVRLAISEAVDPDTTQRPVYAAVIREPRGTLSQAAAQGDTVIHLNSVVEFEVDDEVTFKPLTADTETLKITSLDRAANTITLASGLSKAFAVSDLVRRLDKERVSNLYRSENSGTAWLALGRPGDADGGTHPGGQALTHFSMLADRTNPNVVFVGGDRQQLKDGSWPNTAGATNFTGRLFRGVLSGTATTWSPITDGGADPDGAGPLPGTGPHADSRNMVFEANGDILEVDDGGIYRLTNPNLATPDPRQWTSLNGNLRLTEFVSVAYDSVNDVIIGGAQDNGVSRQDGPNNFTWTHLIQGDGMIVQAATVDGESIKYGSAQGLGQFQAFTDLSDSGDYRGLEVNGTGLFDDDELADFDGPLPFTTRWVLNQVDPSLLLIGTSHLYEEDPDFLIGGDPGDDVTLQNGNPVWAGFFKWKPDPNAKVGPVTALAYGGRERDGADALVDKPRIAYAGVRGTTGVGAAAKQVGQLLLRLDEGQNFLEIPSWTTGAPKGAYIKDLVLHPHNWRKLYVVDSANRVWMGQKKAGGTGDFDYEWFNISGNIGQVAGVRSGKGDDDSSTIEVVVDPGPTAASNDDTDILLVGGKGGVFRSVAPAVNGHWSEFGRSLPNILVTDLHYDPTDDLLLAGTLGRGAFTLSDALAMLKVSSVITITGTAADDALRLVVNPAQPWMLDLYAFDAGGIEPATPIKSFDLTGIDSLAINTLGGNDTITLDARQGLIFVPGGITVTGGADTDSLLFEYPVTTFLSGTPAGGPFTGAEWLGNDGFGEQRVTRVDYATMETVPDLGVAPAAPAAATSSGLQGLGSVFGELLSRSLSGEDLPFVNSASLNNGFGGRVLDLPDPLGLPKGLPVSQVRPGGLTQIDNGQSIFDRILAVGLDALDFQTLATTVSSSAELAAKLDALDDVPGNVTLSEVGGVTTFVVQVEKQLSGIVGIELDGSAVLDSLTVDDGTLTLAGQAEIGFDARLELTFGVDANGFFIQPNASAPELSVSNITLDGSMLNAEGNYGFQGVAVNGATVAFDPLLELNFKFHELPGEPADGKIRLSELGDVDAAGRTEFMVDSPGVQDLQVQANLQILPVLPGLGSLFPIDDTTITITWADLESSTPVATTSADPDEGGVDFKNFLKLDPAELLAQFRSLSVQIGGISANVDVDIPFIEQGFDQLVSLAQTFDDRVVSQLFVKNGDPLSAIPSFTTIQGLVSTLSSSLNNLDAGYLIDLANVGDFVTYDAATKSVLFQFQFSKDFSLSDTLAMGFDLEEGLADLDFSTNASITASLTADVTLGLDLKAAFDGESPAEWLFLKDTTFAATVTVTANDVDAAARFGFLGIQIVDGSATINAGVTVTLTDPGVGPEADGRITIGEIISGLGDPATLIDFDLAGSANLALPISAPFLGITPGPDTTLGIDWTDLSDPDTISVQLPTNLGDMGNFTNMDAGTFVSLLGQVTSWLGDFGDSDAFALDVPMVGDVLRGVMEASDLLRDTLLIDDLDNDNPADDVPKLLDAANQPSFVTATTRPWATVQELAQKLTELLGPGSPVTYDAASQSLLVNLSLAQTFGSIDVPLDFNLDFAPLGDLTSEGSLHLSADGELGITLGIYLGNEGGVELDTGTLLSSLKDGAITFNKDLVIAAPNEVSTVYGRLTDDAAFSLKVDGGAFVEVTVDKDNTSTNVTVADLAADVNAALGLASLAAQVLAIADGNRLVLRRVGDTGALEIDVQNGTPAYTQLGFRDAQLAALTEGQLRLRAAADVSGFVGRLSADAAFTVTMNTANGGAPVSVSVPKIDTDSNRNIVDVVVDVQKAIDNAEVGGVHVLKDKIKVGSMGRKVLLTAKAPGTTNFSITAVGGNPAVTQLGLGTSNTGSGTDIVVTTRDGAVHNVSFDNLPTDPTLGDVISAIETQTAGKVDVQFTDGNTRLRLVDTTGSGSAVFKVENAVGSLAANLLGILGADVVDPDDPDETRDYQFNSAPLGGVDLLDRLFIQNAHAEAGFVIDTPAEGVTVTARFGFVSVVLNGDGHLEGGISIGLKDPDQTDPDGRITLRRLERHQHADRPAADRRQRRFHVQRRP